VSSDLSTPTCAPPDGAVPAEKSRLSPKNLPSSSPYTGPRTRETRDAEAAIFPGERSNGDPVVVAVAAGTGVAAIQIEVPMQVVRVGRLALP
jgi:hypothetical protein